MDADKIQEELERIRSLDAEELAELAKSRGYARNREVKDEQEKEAAEG